MTISDIGRQFDVSRQAASKIVAELRERGYMQVTASTTDQREKVVELTPKAIEHVTARLRAAGELDRAIRERIGDAGLDELYKVLEAVGEVSRGKPSSIRSTCTVHPCCGEVRIGRAPATRRMLPAFPSSGTANIHIPS